MFVILYLLQMSDPGQQTIQEIICGAQGDNDNNYESSITDESSSNESDDAQSDVSSSDCSEENGDSRRMVKRMVRMAAAQKVPSSYLLPRIW